MALRKKEMKKSSYYVWFLGAQECRGLRGEEYVRPVVRYFIDQERDTEPMKVTLQVSGRGLKIIQSFAGSGEPPKHFIPHHAITCVVQEPAPNDDIVSAILLIYNPITKCPVHVHSYRCDSPETASILRYQLSQLIEREENQRKLGEIESRLEAKGLLSRGDPGVIHRSPPGSDGRSTKDSESSGSWDRDQNRRRDRIANLYDSLAAELRQKLGRKVGTPILLPPRDYDTFSRKQGRLEGIDERRSRQANIVGVNGVKRVPRDDSSGKSSGIGSDEASSPLHDRTFHTRDSSSDEDWENEPRSFSEESLFLVQSGWKQLNEYKDSPRKISLPKDPRKSPAYTKKKSPENRQRTPSPASPRQSFAAAREKFLMMEKKQIEEQKQVKEIKRQPSRAREDWSKNEKDAGYVSKDRFGTRDTGYGSKSGKVRDTTPPKKTIAANNNYNRQKKAERSRKESREELMRRSYSRELNCAGSCSSSCNSAECSYDRLCKSTDAIDGFDNYPSRNYRQIKNPLPKNRSYDQLNSRRKSKPEEIRRNKSFDELERNNNYDNHNRRISRPTRYRSQEEVHHRKREEELSRRREEELRRREDEALRRTQDDTKITHQAINRFVNKDKLKRQGYVETDKLRRQSYVELDSNRRYPGLDRETARLHHHSLQHLPIARGPLGGPTGPVGPGTRPSYERSQSEIPHHYWQQSHGFGRYSYAEPTRAPVGIASGY